MGPFCVEFPCSSHACLSKSHSDTTPNNENVKTAHRELCVFVWVKITKGQAHQTCMMYENCKISQLCHGLIAKLMLTIISLSNRNVFEDITSFYLKS